jgi:hypothetical protein
VNLRIEKESGLTLLSMVAQLLLPLHSSHIRQFSPRLLEVSRTLDAIFFYALWGKTLSGLALQSINNYISAQGRRLTCLIETGIALGDYF